MVCEGEMKPKVDIWLPEAHARIPVWTYMYAHLYTYTQF